MTIEQLAVKNEIFTHELIDGFFVHFKPLANRERFFDEHYYSQTLNRDSFAEKVLGTVIRGWDGLTVEKLEALCEHQKWDLDASTPVPYSESEALLLFGKSIIFRDFILAYA